MYKKKNFCEDGTSINHEGGIVLVESSRLTTILKGLIKEYLLVVITADGNTAEEIKNRIQNRNQCLYALQK